MSLYSGVPSHLVEPTPEAYEPRASRLPHETVEGIATVRSELWMGGVHAAAGEPLRASRVLGAWVVDCAGELPPDLAAGAARHLPRVFADIEAVPANLDRIHALVQELAEAMQSSAGPERVYVLCKQGLNRSGLVSALLLRALGARPLAAVKVVRQARPGALNNTTFVRLVTDG